jgi:hypothetical protein
MLKYTHIDQGNKKNKNKNKNKSKTKKKEVKNQLDLH